MNNASKLNFHNQNRDTRCGNLSVTDNESSKGIILQVSAQSGGDPQVTPLSKITGLPVDPFNFDLLPTSLQPWAIDMQHRLQCPPDYIGVGIMVGLAASVGNKITIYPKAQDSWEVVPNLWGLLIGGPSSMKSPALDATLKPIHTISEYLLTQGLRFIVKDTTVEQLQIIQSYTPTGILYIQDEISALFRKFDQPSNNDRPYLLEAFNGNSSYFVDRVTRDSIYIEKNTLSLIGGIQPSVLQEIFQSNGSSDDGFIQRLQLAVWPDKFTQTYIDSKPDEVAYQNAKEVYRLLYNSDDKQLRFNEAAQVLFEAWYKQTIVTISSLEDDGKFDLASHITKYRKLVPALALLTELANNIDAASVSEESIVKAIEWASYLVTHAKRIYGHADPDFITAENILDKRSKLNTDFSPSEITQRGWKDLKQLDQIKAGIDILVEHKYLIPLQRDSTQTGGKPSLRYRWNKNLE